MKKKARASWATPIHNNSFVINVKQIVKEDIRKHVDKHVNNCKLFVQ